jgi:oligosaccharide repeat unit polymerase
MLSLYMSLFFLVILIINLAIGIIAAKRFPITILIITSWWYFWLFVSSFSLTGLKIPSLETYGVYMSMLLSFSIGSFAFSANRINKNSNDINGLALTKISKKNNLRIDLLVKFLIFIAAPVVFYYLIKSILIMRSSTDLDFFRGAVFGDQDTDSIIFGPGWIAYLFNTIIMSSIYIGMFVGSFVFVLNGRKKLFVISSILMIASGIMMLGRFNIYLVLVFLVICLLLKKSKIIYKIKNLIITLMIFIAPMFAIGAARGIDDVDKQVAMFVVDYHSLGFSLFDNELFTPESSLNSKDKFGFASLGIIENSFFILFRKLGLTDRLGSVADVDLNSFRDLSGDESDPKFYNAYGTIVYSMYYDGKIVFVIFLSLIFGYYCSKHTSAAFNKLSVKHGSLVFLYLYLGIFGIFQPLLMTYIWLPIIGINLLFINFRKNLLHAK